MTGSIILATDQGLGYLAKDFYDNGIIDVVSIHHHTTRENHNEWYPNAVDKEELLLCDTLLFFETAFDWEFVKRAKDKGIKIVLMPMYECTNRPLPVEPDLILSPSLLDHRYYPESTLVTVPVTADWKLRKEAKVFVHNAGNGGLAGRNGTADILEAMKFVKSPIKLIIRSQSLDLTSNDPRVVIEGAVDSSELWATGDVFLFPEKFNGLSLPAQEAFASGMAVMCGDRFPMNQWLPIEIMIDVDRYTKECSYTEFESAVYSPRDIAKTIDLWYGKDITKLSLKGKKWGEDNSWDKLKDNYLKLCEK